MAAQEPGQQTLLTALPRLEDLPKSGDGYDPDKVREAFEAFRRHSAQLQAQLRVLQAASRSGQSVEPTGHAVRMDALHLIRTASEFADTVEADAQKASEAQLAKTEEEVRRRRREQQDRESEIERVGQAIVDAVQQATEAARTPPAQTRPAPTLAAPPVSSPATPKIEETKTDQPAPEASGEQEAQSEGSAPAGESQDDQQP